MMVPEVRAWVLFLVVAVAAIGGVFSRALADAVPLPQPRPAAVSTGGGEDTGANRVAERFANGSPDADPAPLPVPRPPQPAGAGMAGTPVLPSPPMQNAPASGTQAGGCLVALGAAGADFEVVPPIETDTACGIEDAVIVRRIGDTNLLPPATLSCDTALRLTRFTRSVILPETRRLASAGLRDILIAASYDCRGRNRVPGARLSEHSFGRAVDIRGLHLSDGSEFAVTPRAAADLSTHARLQRSLRQAACGPFTTVLGPGSDAHHDDHFHFDSKPRRNPYCR
ncbi:extensin family protein [Stappia sp.]|uniref:extensin-like domain-containing protein n=1 Tax=Stappia sp. TaxID=1870903 RepID=UPI003A990496